MSYLERGNSFYAGGNLDRAIGDYDIAIAFDPGWVLGYYNRGVARYAKGDLDRAMYVAVVMILLGEAIFFMSALVLIEAGVFFVLATLFVVLYEEPTLRRNFGDSYERYTIMRLNEFLPDTQQIGLASS